MNTKDEDQDTVQTAAYNPFPEPQTIPSGWDTSEFFSAPPADSVERDQQVDQSQST